MGDEPSPVTPLSQKEATVAPLSQGETSHGSLLSPWLRLMLAEIARKREEHESARTEAARRVSEGDAQAGCVDSGGTENPPLT